MRTCECRSATARSCSRLLQLGLLYVDKTKPAWAVDSDREMETTAFFDPPGKAPPLLTLRAILQCEAAITGPLFGSATVDVAGDTTRAAVRRDVHPPLTKALGSSLAAGLKSVQWHQSPLALGRHRAADVRRDRSSALPPSRLELLSGRDAQAIDPKAARHPGASAMPCLPGCWPDYRLLNRRSTHPYWASAGERPPDRASSEA